jgi:hypothetical protein
MSNSMLNHQQRFESTSAIPEWSLTMSPVNGAPTLMRDGKNADLIADHRVNDRVWELPEERPSNPPLDNRRASWMRQYYLDRMPYIVKKHPAQARRFKI